MKFYRLFSDDEAAAIVAQIKDVSWAQGRASSEYVTEHVKRNRELNESPLLEEIKTRFTHSELWEENFATAMFPPRFNRYGIGDEYKTHADSALMGGALRTDLACTLFLNDDYEGGELFIDNMEIKAGPGVAVVYPCWRPHSVKRVTKGERIAAITWIQTRFRDETQRELLQIFRGVLGDINRDEAEGRHYASLSTVYSKLTRMWMEN